MSGQSKSEPMPMIARDLVKEARATLGLLVLSLSIRHQALLPLCWLLGLAVGENGLLSSSGTDLLVEGDEMGRPSSRAILPDFL